MCTLLLPPDTNPLGLEGSAGCAPVPGSMFVVCGVSGGACVFLGVSGVYPGVGWVSLVSGWCLSVSGVIEGI